MILLIFVFTLTAFLLIIPSCLLSVIHQGSFFELCLFCCLFCGLACICNKMYLQSSTDIIFCLILIQFCHFTVDNNNTDDIEDEWVNVPELMDLEPGDRIKGVIRFRRFLPPLGF